MTVHFDDATQFAIAFARDLDQRGFTTVLIRDIVGRLSIVLDDRGTVVPEEKLGDWSRQIKLRAGSFAAMTPIVKASELFDAGEIFTSRDLQPLSLTEAVSAGSGFIDRQIVGSEWSRVRQDPSRRRVTMYAYKGGVGRSTASFMLAKHLSQHGMNVLVVDLDLESPGVGPLLKTDDESPEYGLVDYLVESAVGATDDLDLVARSDRIQPPGNGEVWVAPARGRPRDGYAYLPKLNRLYADVPLHGERQVLRFADRLDRAITACEERVAQRSRPVDLVLLDSRAGIHDIAAASITQLSDLSMLFATDNQQTWTGYSELFAQWRDGGVAPLIRDRLRMVASMTPPRGAQEYLERFRDRSQACFAATLYDDLEGGDEGAYNPFIDDTSAPHYPLPIMFSADLLGLDQSDSGGWHGSSLIMAAYASFLDGATELVTGESNE